MDKCMHCDICGGCAYQGIPYEEQLKEKENRVLECLAGIDAGEYLGIVASPRIYGYRNKMDYTFGDMVKGGEMTLGMHRRMNYMSVVTADGCQLVHEDFNIILKKTLDFCRGRGYVHYHKKTHKGLMRFLILRRGVRTGEILVNIVTSSDGEFDEEAYAEMISGLSLENRVIGILRTVDDNKGDTVTPGEVHILCGRDYYMERIMGLDFKVSAFSFFQTNVEAAERLYREALSFTDSMEGGNVFDLYCGTGTISQSMALKAQKVTGIEINEDAVEAAEENAGLNGLDNCRFIAGDVFQVLSEMKDLPDLIVMDPPRAGAGKKAMEKILSYGIRDILYISCNPRTMALDLQCARDRGYSAAKIKAFDNFAFTSHVETVALMSRVRD